MRLWTGWSVEQKVAASVRWWFTLSVERYASMDRLECGAEVSGVGEVEATEITALDYEDAKMNKNHDWVIIK